MAPRTSLSPQAAHKADKAVPLLALLAKLGHAPVGSAAGGNFYYLSPLREEKTASFVVSEPKNVWADFGEAPAPGKKVAGGDVLDLVMRLTGFDLPLARLTLRSWAADLATPTELALPSAARGDTYRSGKTSFTDVRTEPLTWKPLLEYLAKRGINWSLVQRSNRTQAHLQQIFYRTAGSTRMQPYFGLGWKTSAGWEVRSERFQGVIGGKGLTWLPGQKRDEVRVFEGFLDYLSALTHYNLTYFDETVLVLNSVNLLAEALPTLQEAQVVHSYLDNDQAGLRALHLMRQVLTRAKVQAHNELYRGFKDVNDWLTKTPPTKPLPAAGAEPSQQSKNAQYWLWVVFNERARYSRRADGKQRQCTFYSWTNDATGLEFLKVLRNRLGDQLAYYRLCERTSGREYKILEWAGFHSPKVVLTNPPIISEEPDYV